MFVGYNAISTRYKLYNSKNDAISISKDVVFDEHSSSKGADSSLDMLCNPFDSFSPSSPPHYPSFDDVPHDDGVLDVVDVTSHPLWARKTLEDSGVDVLLLSCKLLVVLIAPNTSKIKIQLLSCYTLTILSCFVF